MKAEFRGVSGDVLKVFIVFGKSFEDVESRGEGVGRESDSAP